MAAQSLRSPFKNTCTVAVVECECVVCVLLIRKRFSEFVLQEQYNIIKKGRPVPILNLTTKVKKFTRHFNENIYEQNEWLTGCKNIGKLFCWPCILFNYNDKSIFVSAGFCDLNNLHKNVKKHALSKPHLEAVFKEKTFIKTRIDEHSLDSQISLCQYNKLVNKNRSILKRLIDVTCYLSEHELSFSGSSKRGNYMDLLHFLAKYDETLNHHLDQSSTVFHGSSDRIQNDLINCLGSVILETIKNEIKDVSFISIILDETTDITNLSQLSVVVRYVKKDVTVQERFFGFFDITAEAMYTIVCSIVQNKLNSGTKLVAQSYAGAGRLGEVQAKVKATFNTAIFVHSYAHRLNLVLSQSVASIEECKVFFLTLSGLASFFSKSTKRTQTLNEMVKRFPKVWNYNGRLVGTVYDHRESLILLFENILNNKSDWDSETTNGARGYLELLKNDFNFNFLLNLFYDIFPHTDVLDDILQTHSNDIGFCITKIEEFEQNLLRHRDKFELVWNRTKTDNSQPENKTSYRRLFVEIIDNMARQIRDRFKNFSDLKFVELCNFDKYRDSPFPEEALHSLEVNYNSFFDIHALRSQLSVLYTTPEAATKNLLGMLQFLKETGLDKAYCEVTRLCELVLTIPVTSALVESNCSVFKRIKNFVRNSTGEKRLSNLALLSIEKDLVKDLSQNPKFYDDVIDEFSKVNRRIELHYKYGDASTSKEESSHSDQSEDGDVDLKFHDDGDSSKTKEIKFEFLDVQDTQISNDEPESSRSIKSEEGGVDVGFHDDDDSETEETKPDVLDIEDTQISINGPEWVEVTPMEFDKFGVYIVEQLRQLPIDAAHKLQSDIVNLVAQTRLEQSSEATSMIKQEPLIEDEDEDETATVGETLEPPKAKRFKPEKPERNKPKTTTTT